MHESLKINAFIILVACFTCMLGRDLEITISKSIGQMPMLYFPKFYAVLYDFLYRGSWDCLPRTVALSRLDSQPVQGGQSLKLRYVEFAMRKSVIL